MSPPETPRTEPSEEEAEGIARSMARLAMCRAVPVIERNDRPHHVRLLDIPPPWQDEFRAALRGSARPLVDGDGECAWAWDWADWIEGRFPRG